MTGSAVVAVIAAVAGAIGYGGGSVLQAAAARRARGAVGILLLGDAVRPGWAVPGGLAVIAALVGCVSLSSLWPSPTWRAAP